LNRHPLGEIAYLGSRRRMPAIALEMHEAADVGGGEILERS